MNDVVTVAACRTVIGRHGGVLRSVSALELTIPFMHELMKRANHPALSLKMGERGKVRGRLRMSKNLLRSY